jgi:predicted ester cyclase
MMDETKTASRALAVMERMLNDGFARGEVGVVDELCAPDLVEHQFGLRGTGLEAIAKVKSAMQEVHRGMPDMRFSIEDWAEHGDTIWVRAEGVGTNTGPFFGPPSGKPVRITVFDVARIVDGRIVEHWGVPDRFALLVQTGRLDDLLPARTPSA